MGSNLIETSLPTMLPTITPKVENENPKFADLYSRLTVDLLNPDGTTRNRPVREVEEDEALERDLRSYSALLAKDELLLNALREVQLPDGVSIDLSIYMIWKQPNQVLICGCLRSCKKYSTFTWQLLNRTNDHPFLSPYSTRFSRRYLPS